MVGSGRRSQCRHRRGGTLRARACALRVRAGKRAVYCWQQPGRRQHVYAHTQQATPVEMAALRSFAHGMVERQRLEFTTIIVRRFTPRARRPRHRILRAAADAAHCLLPAVHASRPSDYAAARPITEFAARHSPLRRARLRLMSSLCLFTRQEMTYVAILPAYYFIL